MNAIFELKDDWGQVFVYEDKVVIERKGIKAFLTQGMKGGKSIPFASLTSIQFKPAGVITNGFIQFGVLGDVGCKGGVIAAGYDENTVFFQKKNSKVADEIRVFLEKKIAEKANGINAVQQAPSSADELKKFKELLDMGVISREEFDAKKKQLLGL